MFHFDIDFQDKNGERHMLAIRAQALLGDLEKRIVCDTEPLHMLEFQPCKLREAGDAWLSYHGEEWPGDQGHDCCLRHKIRIPMRFAGKKVVYTLRVGDTRYWEWANPQVGFYLDGVSYAGMDSNHRDVELTSCAEGGEEFSIALAAYRDRLKNDRPICFLPMLRAIDTEVLSLYYDLRVALEAAHTMTADDLARIELIQGVNEAFNLLELHAQGEAFSASVRRASECVRGTIYTGHRGGGKPAVAAVGSTHIDVAWLWRYEQTREKAVRSFSTAVRLIDQNPEYIFMSSQPQLYEFVRQDDPALYAEIKKRVVQGRWEPEGGMWVEADTNLTSGESLVRQIVYGKRFFRQEFGKDCEVLWLPDDFGQTGALPQLMRKSGLKYFVTTKLSLGEFDKMPYDTFRWRGIDGSEVLAHFMPTVAAEQEAGDFRTTYNGELKASWIVGAWRRYQQKDLNREVLGSFGHGDGGGGTTQEMLEQGKRIAMGLPGVPDLHFSGVGEFFHRLESELAGNRRVPVWEGELYFENHRGTYTSQAGIKRRNRENETRLHDAENFSVLARLLTGLAYPAERLRESWKLLLLNQFHDVLPGSSIPEVYADAFAHHAQIELDAQEICADALDALTAQISQAGLTVFNSLPFARTAPVRFAWEGEGAAALSDGTHTSPAVRLADGMWLALAENVPAKGWRTYHVVPAAEKIYENRLSRVLENDDSRIEFDENWNISRYFCKHENRDLMRPGDCGARFLAFEDRPNRSDAWNLMVYYPEKSEAIDAASAELLENNAVRTVVRVTRRYRNSRITLDYILYRRLPGLHLHCKVDWHEQNTLLKLDFPAAVNAVKATYGIQFGSIERPIHQNTLWDHARFEVCAQKWFDLSDGGFGLTLLSDCKYGCDVLRGHLRLTVLRSATFPDPQQDQGEQEFSCCLLPHGGAVSLSQAQRAAYGFQTPLWARRSAGGGRLAGAFSLLSTDRENVLVETLKQAEGSDALVLRAYECGNEGCEVHLRLHVPFTRAFETDLLEENRREIPCGADGLRLHFAPFEVKTILIELI